MAELAASLRNVHKNYGEASTLVRALDGVNLEVVCGELLLLVGPSGCGKTTLLSVLCGILDATSGDVEVFGQRMDRMSQEQKTAFRRENIGFIFQQYNLLPSLTAAENVAVPLLIHDVPWEDAVTQARAALAQVGGFAERPGVWAEDADLSFRLKQEGYALLLASGGAVTHFGSPGSVRGLARELYRYGFGAAALSRAWRNGRTPTTELIRHGGAAALAPLLALRLRRRVGLARAMSFWPLITLEHLSFCWGLCMGAMRGVVEKGA